MAFVLPTFNLTVDVYDWSATHPPPTLRATYDCQLRGPNMTMAAAQITTTGFTSVMVLLLPPLTDIRDRFNAVINRPDFVQVPAGSGRWYFVVQVDDIAKGFPNEHRYAYIQKFLTGPWPTPSP